MRAISISRDYCQFLVVSQKNYSLTYYAEHSKKCSHDAINRFLNNEKYSANLLWEHVKGEIVFSENGYLGADDTVLEKKKHKENTNS